MNQMYKIIKNQATIMSTPKFNSKGKLIEELDMPVYNIDTRGPFQSPKPVSPKRANAGFPNQTQTLSDPSFSNPPFSNPPFGLKVEEEEILAWCEAYQNLKKRGINIYKI